MYKFHFDLTISGEGDYGDAVDEMVCAYADIEESDPALIDMGVGLKGSTGALEIDMTIDIDDLEAALHKALGTLRAAIHTAGGSTPNWEEAHSKVMQSHLKFYLESQRSQALNQVGDLQISKNTVNC